MNLRKVSEKLRTIPPIIWISFYVSVSIILLAYLPHLQLSFYNLDTATNEANLVNQYRATLAQIIGGGAVAIGVYFAWENFRISQENLKVSQKGQITERFSRAIDQLGNSNLEIRLGGIYSLEGIANEYEEYYLPTVEILTAYVRNNSSTENKIFYDEVFLDIQTILTVIGRRKYPFDTQESTGLDLHSTFLKNINLENANLKGANLQEANLEGAILQGANLEEAHLVGTNLRGADLEGANLEKAYLDSADLTCANLEGANLEKADLTWVNLQGAILQGANLEGADLTRANFIVDLPENFNFTPDVTSHQLSKVKTLFKATLPEELRRSLKENYPEKYSVLVKEPDEDE